MVIIQVQVGKTIIDNVLIDGGFRINTIKNLGFSRGSNWLICHFD